MVKISFDDTKNFAVMLWCGCVIIFIVTLTRQNSYIFYRKTTSYKITKGEHFSLEIEKAEVDLTPEMLQRWFNYNFKTILWLIYFFCRWNLSMLDSQSETAAWNLSMLDSQSETAACVAVLLSHISK
jgi:hypothetical protein